MRSAVVRWLTRPMSTGFIDMDTVTAINQDGNLHLHESGDSWDECSVTAINQPGDTRLHGNDESADPYSFAAGLAFHRKLQAAHHWREAKIASMNGLSEFPRYFNESKDGSCCGQCGEKYTENQMIVLAGLNYIYAGHDNWNYQRYTLCEKCAGDKILNNPYRIIYTCDICNRKILGNEYHFKKGDFYCSKKCYWSVANKNARFYEMFMRERKPTTCAVCSTQFTPNRTDSRYCSNKCRQKAYRLRTKE